MALQTKVTVMTRLPRGPFGTIVADPPWAFENQATRAATGNHYASISTVDLGKLPVGAMAASAAHLYLWTTGGHLIDGDATWLCKVWGFVPKYALTWVKTASVATVLTQGKVEHKILAPLTLAEGASLAEPRVKLQIGLGNWFRRCAEACVFAVRGPMSRGSTRLPEVLFASRGAHSAKPEVLQDLAEAMSPGPRVELFARRKRAGWTTWGNEV